MQFDQIPLVLTRSAASIIWIPYGHENLTILSFLFELTEPIQHTENKIIARQAIDSPGILGPVGRFLIGEHYNLHSGSTTSSINRVPPPEPGLHRHMRLLHLQRIKRVSLCEKKKIVTNSRTSDSELRKLFQTAVRWQVFRFQTFLFQFPTFAPFLRHKNAFQPATETHRVVIGLKEGIVKHFESQADFQAGSNLLQETHRLRKSINLQVAAWGPNATNLVLVINNDLYFIDQLSTAHADGLNLERLTLDGKASIIANGISDWIYSSEFDSNDCRLQPVPSEVQIAKL